LLAYMRKGKALDLVHTEVPPAWERRGIAALLAHAAMEYAKERGLRVIPSCPYVGAYLEQHPEYATLVDREVSHRFETGR